MKESTRGNETGAGDLKNHDIQSKLRSFVLTVDIP